jgi:dienelactone hydrolase
MKLLTTFSFVLLFQAVSTAQEIAVAETHEYGLYSKKSGNMTVTIMRSELFDSIRERSIPIIMYHPKNGETTNSQKLVIISHGYGFNSGKSYLGYSFIADYLASKGYFVVSLQHELPNDDSLAMNGEDLKDLRMPNWERGIKNIQYTIQSLASEFDYIDTSDITLIGHSNGGDMSMLFAAEYPNEIKRVISLDNRRMPIPATTEPKILSIRSSDQKADEGVIPTEQEQLEYNIKIVQLKNTLHNDMCNSGTPEQRAEMLYIIGEFMNK